jgi:signal transduction histidine kinase
MRRLIDSIAEFRADPERGAPLDPENISLFADDEMAVAGRELSALQRELRVALSRNARLSELGAAVAKVSHDLRNILSGALLVADRLATNPDPQTAQAGELLTHSVERANELIRQTLEFTRDGPPPLTRSLFALRDLVDEAIEGAAPMGFAARNSVDADLTVEADYEKLLRVFENLLRNAGEAGARMVRIGAQITKERVSIRVEDDGPGLAEELRANLFRPFVSGRRGGTGLGLAIARELMRAHGGDIELVETGPSGTAFQLILFARQRPNSGGDLVHTSGKRAL